MTPYVDVLPLPLLYTPEEAASYLGVSAYTVRARLNAGEIPGRKCGGRWLIRAVDLASYVEPNNIRCRGYSDNYLRHRLIRVALQV